VVLEATQEIGGGVCGDEVPLPGFLANTCAAEVRLSHSPVIQDLELYNCGYKAIFPDVGEGIIFDDETALVTWSPFVVADEKTSRLEISHENIEKSMKEIARFSERDAQTYNHLIECWAKKWGDALWEQRFNPPAPWGVQDSLERLVGDKEYPLDQRWFSMSLGELGMDLWDSEEMRINWIAHAISWGGITSSVTGISQVLYILQKMLALVPPQVVKGGTHTIAHALQRRFSYSGGEFLVEAEVDKVLVDNGKARGVRLVDGTEIRVRKLVVSNLDLYQTFLRFIGAEYFHDTLVRKIENMYRPFWRPSPILWGHFAVHELPKYKAESFNPDCASLVRRYITPKDYEWLAMLPWSSRLDKLSWQTHEDSRWDRRAPDGKHILLIEQFFLVPSEESERGFRDMKREYSEAVIKEWQKYAPNMTRENLIGAHFHSGLDISKKSKSWPGGWPGLPPTMSAAGRNCPLPELSGYKMPIENLYLASAWVHPGPFVLTSPGYNCYKVIAEDFGLRKPWEEKGRPY
jgi:phytoene dehydrogenase-like protein